MITSLSAPDVLRREVLAKLVVRNRDQCTAFRGLIQQYQEALVREQQAVQRATALERENEQLRAGGGGSTHSTTVSSAGATTAEVAQLKAELTDAYRRNSEAVREQLRLSQELKAMAERRADAERATAELRAGAADAAAAVSRSEEAVRDKDATVAVLRGELQSLQLEFVACEEALRKAAAENERLVDRWMRKMDEDSRQLSEASRMFAQVKELQQQQQQQSSASPQPQEAASAERKAKSPFAGLAALASSLFEAPPSVLDTSAAAAGSGAHALGGMVVVPREVRLTLTGHSSDVTGLCFNAGGTLLASCSGDKTVRLWDSGTGALRATFQGATQGMTNVAMSLNDEMLLGCSSDNAARIWMIQGARLRHTLTGHVGKVACGVFVDTAARVVTGSHDRTIKIWDLVKGYAIKTMFCMSSCNDCCLVSGGAILASAHVDKAIRLWDLAAGTSFAVIDAVHEGQVTCVAKSDDGRLLLTSGRDNVLHIIDPNTKEKVATFQHPEYRNGLNWSRCCFSPDGRFVAAGSANGSIFVWNTTNNKLETTLATPSGPQTPAVCVAWHPGGSQLAVTSKNDVNIWS